MITARLNDQLEANLQDVVKKSGMSKSTIINNALEQYLEDLQDYLLAKDILEKINNGEEILVSWDQVQADNDL